MTKEERLKKVSDTKQKQFQDSIKHVNIDELKRMYLEENKTYEYVRQYYNLTGYTLDKILRENNIKKSRKQSAPLVLETKYRKAGSKELYDQQTYKTTCSNIEAKGLTLEEHYKHVGQKCSKAWGQKTTEELEEFVGKLHDSYFSHSDKIEHAKIERIKTNIQKYGVDNTYKLSQYVSNSKTNSEFLDKLVSRGASVDTEVFLASNRETFRGYRYDFKINNVLVELNPWPFHNSTWSPVANQLPTNKNYHYDKTLTAANYNYRCIHVWDWDDQEKIINSVTSNRQRVFARNCDVKIIRDKLEVDTFLNTNHFQNTCKNQTVCLGLYYKDALIQLMTFGKPRYNKNYQWELLRLCSAPNYYVVGGSQRLFKYFIRLYNPASVISYCDNSKFSGAVYRTLGMSLLSYGLPTKHWFHPKLNKHITDNYLRQRGFDQLLGNLFGTYGKGTNNEELMLHHGFVEIYDCGQSTYIWHKE